jgi:hypothetical protein
MGGGGVAEELVKGSVVMRVGSWVEKETFFLTRRGAGFRGSSEVTSDREDMADETETVRFREGVRSSSS